MYIYVCIDVYIYVCIHDSDDEILFFLLFVGMEHEGLCTFYIYVYMYMHVDLYTYICMYQNEYVCKF
jgi:hypothetical protein